MIYVQMKNGLPIAVKCHNDMSKEDRHDLSWQSRWDWNSFEEVQTLASYITAITGDTYLPVDNTESVAPRYDIIKAPKIGDEVSRCFNGDCYPCGTIIKITKAWRVTTSDGKCFYRRKNSSTWLEVNGGPFGLVEGHIFSQNPHF